MATGTHKPLLHISEAAQELRLSHYQARSLIEKGRLKGEKIGRRWYVSREAIAEFVATFGAAS